MNSRLDEDAPQPSDRPISMVHRRHYGASGPLCDRRRQKGDSEEPGDHALGRSRGGFTTKIRILCDGHGLPLAFRLTAGQTHESQALVDLLAEADDRVLDEDGERIAWPFALGGDKGYRADTKRRASLFSYHLGF